MAKLISPTPTLQFFDSSGNPLASGTLTVYLAGTTTLASIYSDAAGTAESNPVTLDSRGEVNIFLDEGIQYKFLLKDSTASTIYTVDNVYAPSDGIYSDGEAIKDDNGNELIKFAVTASAVNELTVTNAATGNAPALSATGGDTNIDVKVTPKGTGDLDLSTGSIKMADTEGLKDANGNEVVRIGQTASAVNQIDVINAATGNGPIISATGDDTNIDITLDSKGTGNVNLGSADTTLVDVKAPLNVDGTITANVIIDVEGSASSAGGIRFREDTDNGTNYIGLVAPASVASSVNLILPDGDGSNGQLLSTNGSGTLGWATASGGMVPLLQASASNSNELEFATNIDSTYEHYVFIGNGIIAGTNTDQLYCQFSTDGGSSYVSAGYIYAGRDMTNSAHADRSFSTTTIVLSAALDPTPDICNFVFHLYNPAGTDKTHFFTHSTFTNSSAVNGNYIQGGKQNTAAAHNAIKFYMSSGTIPTGEIRMYGVKKS